MSIGCGHPATDCHPTSFVGSAAPIFIVDLRPAARHMASTGLTRVLGSGLPVDGLADSELELHDGLPMDSRDRVPRAGSCRVQAGALLRSPPAAAGPALDKEPSRG